jgi:hypothetical protein
MREQGWERFDILVELAAILPIIAVQAAAAAAARRGRAGMEQRVERQTLPVCKEAVAAVPMAVDWVTVRHRRPTEVTAAPIGSVAVAAQVGLHRSQQLRVVPAEEAGVEVALPVPRAMAKMVVPAPSGLQSALAAAAADTARAELLAAMAGSMAEEAEACLHPVPAAAARRG